MPEAEDATGGVYIKRLEAADRMVEIEIPVAASARRVPRSAKLIKVHIQAVADTAHS
jgi:hypothetical protein